jgi:hypothetical protein
VSQNQVRTGPVINDAASFTSSMVDGSHPDSPRLFIKPRQGWQISQPTHTAAAFSAEMVAGAHPDKAALPFRAKIGWTWSEHTFATQMTPEQFAGWHPDTGRLFLAPRIPQPLDQTKANTAAPFGYEMVAGWHPDTGRFFVKPRQGWQDSQTTFDVTMTPEMWTGSRPDTSRLWIAPRIPLPISQTTHVAAPFGQEMVVGHHPDTARFTVTGKAGWQTTQTTFLVQMTPEMFAGWHPDQSRAWLAPRIPLPISQPTHVSAPFSPEMVAGHQPPIARAKQYGRQIVGWIQGLIDGLFGSTSETAFSTVDASYEGDTDVIATSITLEHPVSMAVVGSPSPSVMTGQRVGDRITVARPTSATNWTAINYDASILRFDGPGTLGVPTAAGWQFTVIGVGVTSFDASAVSPPLAFTVSITVDGTLIPAHDVTATYERDVYVTGTVQS